MLLVLLLAAWAATHHVTTAMSPAVNIGAANQPAATGALQPDLQLLQGYLDPRKEAAVFLPHPAIPALAVQHPVDNLGAASFQATSLMAINP